VAIAIALVVIGHMAFTDRSWLLYFDGDSMLPALLQSSVRIGQSQDWALSAPLFLPEAALYLGVSALGLPVAVTLTLVGIVNWLVLYGAMRFVAGARRSPQAPFLALGGFSLIASLALLESSVSRDSLEGASLLSTSTYYSATVIGSVLIVGFILRAVAATASTRRTVLLIAMFLVTAFSTLTNPLVVPWCVGPLCLAVAGLAAVRVLPWGRAGAWLLLLTTAVALGMLARLPFAGMLVESVDAIYRPTLFASSAGYYAGLLAAMASSWHGAVELGIIVSLMVVAVVITIRSVRRGEPLVALASTIAWLSPVVVVTGAILAGTFAARYLQPIFFLPPIAIVAGMQLNSPPLRWRALVTAAGIIPLLAAITLVPQATRQTAPLRSDFDSVQCVVDWVTRSGRVGAGQYWTIRAPKAYLPDPRQLVQTDADLDPYVWLVNRHDYDGVERVSFIVDSADSVPTRVNPVVQRSVVADVIECGRYTITDYHSAILPLGVPRH
jgi:hypothetical protein